MFESDGSVSKFTVYFTEAGSGIKTGGVRFRAGTTSVRVSPPAGDAIECYRESEGSQCWLSSNLERDRLYINFRTPLPVGSYRLSGNIYDRAHNLLRLSTSGDLQLAPEVKALGTRNYHRLTGVRSSQTAVYLNDTEIVPLGSSNWEYLIEDLPVGETAIRVKWVDEQGNDIGEREYIFKVDPVVLPTLRITGLTPDPLIGVTEPISQISISLTGVDGGLDIGNAGSFVAISSPDRQLVCRGADNTQECWLTTNAEQDALLVNLASPLTEGWHELEIGIVDSQGQECFVPDNQGEGDFAQRGRSLEKGRLVANEFSWRNCGTLPDISDAYNLLGA